MSADAGWVRRLNITSAVDGVLDICMLAYASWTLIYWICLAAHIAALIAVVVWVLTVPLCATVVVRRARRRDAEPARRGAQWAAVAVVVLALVAAGLSLFVVRPDADDVYYVNRSAWVAEHGTFPINDTLMSDQVYPAQEKPPLSAFEPLIGAAAEVLHLPAASVAYYVMPPLATFLSVLALFRLLRGWRTALPALALAVCVVFLVFDASSNNTFGNMWLGRMFQAKVVLVSLAVPLLYACLAEWSRAPDRVRLLLLLAVGIGTVGLGPTAAMVVPGVALAALLPLALQRQWRRLAGGAVILAAPLVAAVLIHFAGGLSPGLAGPGDLNAEDVLWRVAGSGVTAGFTIAALYAGWLALGGRRSRLVAAAASALVALLLVPGLLTLVNDVSGAGPVLWRLMWLVPVGPLVGALAVAAFRWRWVPRPVAAAVPAAVVALVVLTGTPVWSSSNDASVTARPAWKVQPGALASAEAVIAMASPGDVVVAPSDVSAAIAITTTRVRAVDPRSFYLVDYAQFPGFDANDRMVLDTFEDGPNSVTAAQVSTALTNLDVALACVPDGDDDDTARPVLENAGYVPAGQAGVDVCFRRG